MIELIRGDSDSIECTADQDISSWKIRAELYDRLDVKIRKGTSNVTGGDDTQIKVDNSDPKKFTIYIASGDTDLLNKRANFEIELESPTGETLTRLQDDVRILDQRINWDATGDA